MRLRIIVYYQGKYLYTLSNQGILLSFKDSTIAEQKDAALAPQKYCDEYYKMKKVKGPYIKKNILYLGLGKTVKKPHIKEGKLYLGEQQKGVSIEAIAASVITSLIGPLVKVFGGKKIERRKRRKIIYLKKMCPRLKKCCCNGKKSNT